MTKDRATPRIQMFIHSTDIYWASSLYWFLDGSWEDTAVKGHRSPEVQHFLVGWQECRCPLTPGQDLSLPQSLQGAGLCFSLSSRIGMAWFWHLRQVRCFMVLPVSPCVPYAFFFFNQRKLFTFQCHFNLLLGSIWPGCFPLAWKFRRLQKEIPTTEQRWEPLHSLARQCVLHFSSVNKMMIQRMCPINEYLI